MPSASRSKTTVLVVEDDAVTRELLAQVLSTGGFDVIATSMGERALLTLCHFGQEIDWLMSRLSLPGLINGWVLADEYHQHHPERPVLLMAQDIGTTQMASVKTVHVPSANPMRALEMLKALREAEPDHVAPFQTAQAA
jgi:DNA-binding NtrC family response regulator